MEAELFLQRLVRGAVEPMHQGNNRRAKSSGQQQSSSSQMVEAIYAKLSSRKFAAKRPINPQPYKDFLRARVEKGEAIKIRLGHGPVKNQNLSLPQRVDWAEVFLLCRVRDLYGELSKIYTPGFQFEIVADDLRAQFSNGVRRQDTEAYINSLRGAVQQLGFGNFITSVSGQSEIYHQCAVLSYYSEAELETDLKLCARPEFRTRAESNANKNRKSDGNSDECESRCAYASALRYHSMHRAEELAGLWSFEECMPLRFGRHEKYIQLHTVAEGWCTLPWQGTGCIELRSNGTLVPKVVSPSLLKSQALESFIVPGFEIFGPISVVAPVTVASDRCVAKEENITALQVSGS